MKPLRLLVLLVSLPLLLGGCGEKLEVTDETKPKLKSVNYEELEFRGDLESLDFFLKGVPYTGKSFVLNENGQKVQEWSYKNGKRDGPFVAWHENGQKQTEANWKNGKEVGLQVNWYENGQKAVEANFKDGKEDGLYVAWHKNGQKKAEGNWKDGNLISRKYWNSKGEPVDTIEEARK